MKCHAALAVILAFLLTTLSLPGARNFSSPFSSLLVFAQNSALTYEAVVDSSWGSGYKLILRVTSRERVEAWQTDFILPKDHTLRNIYGASASGRAGDFRINGGVLDGGERREVVLIIDGPTDHERITDFYDELFTPPAFVEATPENTTPTAPEALRELVVSQTITDTWNVGYRLTLDVTASVDVADWTVQVRVPEGYRVSELYGFEADEREGLLALSRRSWNPNLAAGQTAQGVFIVQGSPARQFLEVDPPASEELTESTPSASQPEPVLEAQPPTQPSLERETAPQPESVTDPAPQPEPAPQPTPAPVEDGLTIAQEIPESWNEGYKINVEVTAGEERRQWSARLVVPAGYSISEIYGLTADARTGEVTLRGEWWNADIGPGQSAQGVIIMQGSPAVRIPRVAPTATPQPEPEVAQPDSEPETAPGQPEPTPQPTTPEPTGDDSVTTEAGQVRIVNPQTEGFRYGEVLQKNFLLYQANRGGRLSDEHRIDWRGDATVNDGQDVGRDLSGGYYDAGDHIIFTQPMAFSMTMLAWSGAEYREAYEQAGQLDELRDTLEWGLDWFLRAHETNEQGQTERLWVQVSNGEDHRYWVPPEMIDEYTARPAYSVDKNRPGTEIAAGTASAFAAASILYRDLDPAYADELLQNARALYEFANTYRAKYSDSVPEVIPFYPSWSGYYDELALSGVWMYRATGEENYLRQAEQVYKDNIGYGGDWTYAPDEHKYAALALLAKESPDPFFKDRFREWMEQWVSGSGGVTYTPGGFAHRTYWSSAPLTLGTAYIGEWYHDKVEPTPRYSEFAKNQLDYLLGNNPRGYSYVVGYGNNYPVRPHHRGSAYPQPVDNSQTPNTHTLWGALVGGLVESNDYAHYDVRNDYVANEVGISYNAPLAAASVQQYDNYGGAPLSDEEFDALSGISLENLVSGGPVSNPALEPVDTDGDGLLDRDEVSLGTNGSQRDTDGDGIGDGVEVVNGTNPLDAGSRVNSTRRFIGVDDVAQLYIQCRASYPNTTTTCDFDIPNNALLSPEVSVAIGSSVFTPGKCRVRDQALVRRVRCEEVNTGSEPGARTVYISIPTNPQLATLGGFSLETQARVLPSGETTNIVPFEMDLTDSDGDDVPDFWEEQYATESRVSDANTDADDDGLSNAEEYNLGTDPRKEDTDNDGLGDAQEIDTLYTDPTQANSDSAATPDVDESADETPDGESDFDADAVSNADEITRSEEPLDQVAFTDIPPRSDSTRAVPEDNETWRLDPVVLLLLAALVPILIFMAIYLSRPARTDQSK